MRKYGVLGAHEMNRSGEVPREETEAKAKNDGNSIPVRTVTATKRQSHKGWHFFNLTIAIITGFVKIK